MLYWTIIVFTITLDQVSKIWIINSMELYHSNVVIPGFFNLTYVTNSGAAFSLLADVNSPWRHYFFVGVGSVALIILTVVWFRQRSSSSLGNAALAFIAGGAAGNLIDRIRLGAVVDFIDVYIGSYHWPAFNVADSAICVGVVVYLVFSYLEDKKENKQSVKA
jgi:signal peptidase II